MRAVWACASTCALLALVLVFRTPSVSGRALPPAVHLDVPPRYMWGWGPGLSGYCGSASVQSAGLFYGNWLTEDAVRGTSGGHDAKHELLLGPTAEKTSVLHACAALRLACSGWPHAQAPEHQAFLAWAKRALAAGAPVIFGVFGRDYTDPDYDHIVPMVGYDEEHVLFNDLKHNTTLRYPVSGFVRTRAECSAHGPEWCLPKTVNYGVVVRGNADAEGVLLPVRMRVASRSEPDYSREDRHHQAPTALQATLVVSGLERGQRYALLRYEDPAAVPNRDFRTSRFTAREYFVAEGPEHTVSTTVQSNSTVFFRCIAWPEGVDDAERDRGAQLWNLFRAGNVLIG